MIEAIGTAILLGIILSFSLGPIFFELINTSLRKGFKRAFWLEIGVLASDVIYLIVALFSATGVLKLIEDNEYVKYVGGGIFILFGLYSILKNVLTKEPKKDTSRDDIIEPDEAILDKGLNDDSTALVNKRPAIIIITQIMKGITLNAINPSVLLFWIITCSVTIKNLKNTGLPVLVFFGITLGVMFAVDLTKIYFASKLKRYMTPKILKVIGIIIGLIMIGAGIFIMCTKIDIEIPNRG